MSMSNKHSPSESAPPAVSLRTHSLQRSGRQGWASYRVGSEELEAFLKNPEALFQHSEAVTIKQSPSTLLVKVPVRFPEGEILCGYKKVFRKTWMKRLTDLFRWQDRARHSFEIGQQFLQAGIPTPEPLWVIPPLRWSWNEPAYLGFEWLPGCRDLNGQLAELTIDQFFGDKAIRKQVYSVVSMLATVLGRMHAAGFCHRDLKFSNLLVDRTTTPVQVYVIDLDGASSHTGNVDRWLWNLSRFARDALQHNLISRSMRCRFLKDYLRANPTFPITWKVAWKRLGELVDKRNRRRSKAN
ncbi:MAG: phosphotransferase [Planctomycetaceae bacterium]|nr:phosphotransferase [Planctomycetaceae bacterium]